MANLFHKSLYRPKLVPSYWEAIIDDRPILGHTLDGDKQCDVAIIGGGYTGLSAAMNLAKNSDMKVAVLEAGAIGWGASGRNGGFNCVAATKMPLAQMLRKYGEDATREFWSAQIDGANYTASLEKDEGIDFDRQGQGNWEVAHRPQAYQDLLDEKEQLEKISGINCKTFSKSEFAEIGYDSEEQFGALHMDVGFGLNPLKLALGLGKTAEKYGADLYPHSKVLSWRKEGGEHILTTEKGSLRASTILIATNGFYEDGLYPNMDRRILPVISNIITTRPLTDAELEAHRWQIEEPICNTRNLLFYFRKTKDNRLLFGARGDWTGRPDDSIRMKSWMTQRLYEIFPHWRDVEITHYWRGLVCMSMKLAPSLGFDKDDPSVFYSYGYHANGVNTAPWSGRLIAQLIMGEATAIKDIPKVMYGQAARFPMAGLRVRYLQAAALWYKLRDG